jgi:hypothetical protein
MEDVRAALPASSTLRHPLVIGVLALPGALAGGALASEAAQRALGGAVAPELAIFVGAFAGAALSLRLLRSLLPRLAALPDRSGPDDGPRIALAPARERSPLHLVSAAEEPRVAGGVASLALSFLERRQRVLVIDAGLGAGLHTWLGGVPRLGLAECLAERVPVLGLVQRGPAAGLWMLARGGARRHDAWSRLGRVVDEACSHFDRVIVAAPAAALPSLGYGLVGANVVGWWATAGSRETIPGWAASRFGKALSRLPLPPKSELSPQTVAQALSRLPAAPEPLPIAMALPEPAPTPAPRPAPPEPAIVDCDLHVRERLRFLAWMRSVQRESRSGSEAVLAGR